MLLRNIQMAVLVAIAIPVFTRQLEKSREATDIANVRSAYANVVVQYLDNTANSYSMTVAARQTQADWQGESGTITYQVGGTEGTYSYAAKTSGNSYTVKIAPDASGNASITVE